MADSYFHIMERNIPIYFGKLVVIISNDKDKVKKFVPVFEESEIYGHAIFGPYKGKQGFFVLFNFHSLCGKITHGVIAYEALHVVHFLAEERGFKSDFNNDEAIAYLVGWVTNRIYAFIRKNGFEVK